MDKEKEKLDAGLKSLDHYKIKLPRWRYDIREMLLPIVRWETPYVAWLQSTLRTPLLDSYFAMTANLGTHTFFMIMLPILFWCGYADVGRGMVHILASGVYFSGFVKDMLCLPRPLSPPLQRITMSGSAALEYGFPSTHSTNALSVTVYSIFLLQDNASSEPNQIKGFLSLIAYFYSFSIVLGRLYCGMHGFFDVIWGTVLGIVLGLVQCVYGAWFDTWLLEGEFSRVFLVILLVCVLVRIHPEPADDCPCFDDSLAFSGTMMGIQLGGWHFSRTNLSVSDPIPGTASFDLEKLGWFIAVLRIVIGVIIIFAWRAVMKPTLLRCLPPVFRIVEYYGLTLPRRFFTPASQYGVIPAQRNDDNVIPRVREIPGLLSSMTRNRAVSIGPQSEADAYEALAYREKQRRESTSTPVFSNREPISSSPESGNKTQARNPRRRRRTSSIDEFRAQMGLGTNTEQMSSDKQEADKAEDRALFSKITKPRVRYDVEVITKLVVYSGIGWLAVEGNPIIFELIGLGMSSVNR